ncbi:hypothetical protein UPYG_G00308290 [Umbra pygmaea]|uniref:Uncharacterized protein n=1 Tax=Umbra pygmaea TaxID=75934 RepID=A0ABD0W3K9_UMBPY
MLPTVSNPGERNRREKEIDNQELLDTAKNRGKTEHEKEKESQCENFEGRRPTPMVMFTNESSATVSC